MPLPPLKYKRLGCSHSDVVATLTSGLLLSGPNRLNHRRVYSNQVIGGGFGMSP